MERTKAPTVLTKKDDEWICQLQDGREISLLLEHLEDDSEDNYVAEKIKISFAENDEMIGTDQDFFLFSRDGYISNIDNQNFLLENIFLPFSLRGTGTSQLAVEFFKEFTGGANVYAQNPSSQRIKDGSDLLEPGQKFVKRMQELELILPFTA